MTRCKNEKCGNTTRRDEKKATTPNCDIPVHLRTARSEYKTANKILIVQEDLKPF
jgi:hypothetical protein